MRVSGMYKFPIKYHKNNAWVLIIQLHTVISRFSSVLKNMDNMICICMIHDFLSSFFPRTCILLMIMRILLINSIMCCTKLFKCCRFVRLTSFIWSHLFWFVSRVKSRLVTLMCWHISVCLLDVPPDTLQTKLARCVHRMSYLWYMISTRSQG